MPMCLMSCCTVFNLASGADTGFRKGGGGGPVNCSVLKRAAFEHTHATIFLLF